MIPINFEPINEIKMSFSSSTIPGSISCCSIAHRRTVPTPLGNPGVFVGHTRLGTIPKTRKWTEIVGLFTGTTPAGVLSEPSNIASIAAATLDATKEGLNRATADCGVRYTFYLLTQIALASRTSDFETTLRKHGIQITSDSTVLDLATELQDAIDRYVKRNPFGATDASEIAQKAAGQAMVNVMTSGTGKLFPSETDVRDAVRPLSTRKGFGELGQQFFGNFVARFLNFYLSRVTATTLGGPRLRDLMDVAEFNRSLQAHCNQSARIVRDFCGEWYSKTEYQKGIDLENTSGFLSVAVNKLRSELTQQREEM
ncbi:MAG TPA: hypothetical protein VF753_07705 [Terriglobales bacterium]